MVLVTLAPYRFRLRLYATDRAQYRDGTVEHAQAALYFDGEVNVSRSIDDVDTVLVKLLVHARPETGRRSRGDRDATLLLLLHPVHDGGAVVYLTNLVRYAGVKKYAFGRRCLTGIDVGHDANIAITLDRCCT